MLPTYSCSLQKCSLRIIVTNVHWRTINGKPMPFCCYECADRYEKYDRRPKGGDQYAEEALADQNEACKTSGEVLPTAFIKDHNEVGATVQTQMTFDELRGIW